MQELLVDAAGAAILLAITALSYRLRATDLWGSIAGYLIGLIIALSAGWPWVVVLIAFLVAGSFATRYRYPYKAAIHAAEEKGGARGYRNVLANSAVAALLALGFGGARGAQLALMFAAAIASSTADTFATEIGLLSSSPPLLINRPKSRVNPGISGGVTLLGEGAAALAVAFISILSASLHVISPSVTDVLVVALAGFLGCNIDSLLGGLAQTLYRCDVCGSYTETKEHCGKATKWVKGIKLLGNNGVNLLSTIGAAGIAWLLFIFIG